MQCLVSTNSMAIATENLNIYNTSYIFMYDLEISVFRKSNPSPIEAVVGFVTYIV